MDGNGKESASPNAIAENDHSLELRLNERRLANGFWVQEEANVWMVLLSSDGTVRRHPLHAPGLIINLARSARHVHDSMGTPCVQELGISQ